MDQILAKASNQAVTFAIRSGISLASGYAIKTVSKLLDRIPQTEQKRLTITKNKLQTKINILSISFDLVKLAAARGNTALEATVDLISDLNAEFDVFDETVSGILESLTTKNTKESVIRLEGYMDGLLQQINEAIPIVTLSLVTSGVNMSGQVTLDQISPGRLLQAANLLGTAQKTVGPVFDMVMYSIFYNPSRAKYDDGISALTWKEEYARASVRLCVDGKYQYTFQITEDLDDGRYHDEEARVKRYPLKSVERMFFSASGKLLNLGERSSPVLVIKFVDQEWIALGEVEKGEFEEEDEEDGEDKETSLSLLEYLVRLAKLQQSEQKSILDINDETLALYLHDQPPSTIKSKKDKAREEEKRVGVSVGLENESNVERLRGLKIE